MKNHSTGRLGRLFNAVPLESRSPGAVVTSHAVTLECRSPGSAFHKMRKTPDLGLKPSSMTLCGERRGGFTLIELLVVVLIIGILSAIALPQYQKAVARSRAVEAIVSLRTLTTAQQEYYMANGGYATNLEELSVQVKNTRYYTFSCRSIKDGDMLDTCYAANGSGVYPYFEAYSPFAKNLSSGKMWCVATSAQQHELCRTFGPLDMGSAEGKGYYVVNR